MLIPWLELIGCFSLVNRADYEFVRYVTVIILPESRISSQNSWRCCSCCLLLLLNSQFTRCSYVFIILTFYSGLPEDVFLYFVVCFGYRWSLLSTTNRKVFSFELLCIVSAFFDYSFMLVISIHLSLGW